MSIPDKIDFAQDPDIPGATKLFNSPLFTDIKELMAKFIGDSRVVETIGNMENYVTDLETNCETQEDKKILRKLFRTVNMGSFKLTMPNNRTQLSIHESIRLVKAGLKLASENPIEIHTDGNDRFEVNYKRSGKIIPPDEWDKKRSLEFHADSYRELFVNVKKIKESLQKMKTKLQTDDLDSLSDPGQLSYDIGRKISKIVGNFENPKSIHEVIHAKPLELTESSFTKHDGITMESLISPEQRLTLAFQQLGIKGFDSMFNPESLQDLNKRKVHVIIGWDISLSTEVYEMYKILALIVQQVRRTMKQKIKNSEVLIMPYSEDPLKPFEEVRNFYPPKPCTNHHKAYYKAQEILKHKRGIKLFVDVTDGLSNDFDPTFEAAQMFPKLGINFSQALFVCKFDEHAEYLQNKLYHLLSGDERVQDKVSYMSLVNKVRELADGSGLLVYALGDMNEAILSVLDLGIGSHCREEYENKIKQEATETGVNFKELFMQRTRELLEDSSNYVQDPKDALNTEEIDSLLRGFDNRKGFTKEDSEDAYD